MALSLAVNQRDWERKIASEYVAKGYRVEEVSDRSLLPDFAQPFRPDLIARGTTENVLIEIKSPGKIRRQDYWTEFSTSVAEHAGWRLEIVDPRAQASKTVSTLGIEEVQERLIRSDLLFQSGERDAAILLLWSATEATLRLRLARDAVEISDRQSGSFLSVAYSNGELSREEYDALISLLNARNATAHGYEAETLSENVFAHALAITKRLLPKA